MTRAEARRGVTYRSVELWEEIRGEEKTGKSQGEKELIEYKGF